uniref:Uncharacterized protein n=1 Tax=Cacopsylla melanoneura TaxID=428564 RepID=A0A8D8V4Z9_9HEMI
MKPTGTHTLPTYFEIKDNDKPRSFVCNSDTAHRTVWHCNYKERSPHVTSQHCLYHSIGCCRGTPSLQIHSSNTAFQTSPKNQSSYSQRKSSATFPNTPSPICPEAERLSRTV